MSGSGVRERIEERHDEQEGDEGARVELEARAKRAGWVPREDYRGNQDRWVDADEFLRSAEENLPRAKERNAMLDRKLRRNEQELAALRQGMDELRAHAARNEQRAYEAARTELLAQQQQAVQSADTATYNATSAQLAKLEEQKPRGAAPPIPAPPTEDLQELQRWVASKPWFGVEGQGKDPALTQMVTQLHANYMIKHPGVSNMEAVQAVERMLASQYPEEFGTKQQTRGQPRPRQQEQEELEEGEGEGEDREPAPPPARSRRETPASVSGGTISGPSGRRPGRPTKISELPREVQAEARAAFVKYRDMMADKKNPFTEEEYVRNYLDQ